jgi:hypothetical protein
MPEGRLRGAHALCTLALAAWAVLLAGCGTFTREVTPWLRTTREVPFRLMAESGGAGGYDTSRVERKEGDRWVELRDAGDKAFAFAGGSRVVLDGKLVRPSGPPVQLPCDGELRGTPDGGELVCVQVFDRTSRTGAPETVLVTRIDREGREIGRRQVAVPVKVPAGEPPLGVQVSTDLLGFLPDGLVFAVLWTGANESFANDAVKQPRAFLLRANDRWQELGSLRIGVGQLWALHFPRLWNEANGWSIDLGRILQDSRGEPNP